MANATVLSIIQEKGWSVNRERWFRNMLLWRRHACRRGFFDAHPRFFSTSVFRGKRLCGMSLQRAEASDGPLRSFRVFTTHSMPTIFKNILVS